MNFLGLFRRSSRKSISPDVKLGRNVKVYDFVNLYGCEIGDESRIGTFVEIQRGARVGRRVKVSSHTFICEGVEVGDDVFIGHGVMFINDKYPRAVNPDGQPQSSADWKVVPHRRPPRRLDRIERHDSLRRRDRRRRDCRRWQRGHPRCAAGSDRRRKPGAGAPRDHEGRVTANAC